MRRKKAFFSISAVAKMFSIHQQTIRLYEKEGFITPKRSEGNTRLFSEEDINQLEEVIYLTHKLGINLAGVDMILRLQKKISKMQKDTNKLFEQTEDSVEKDPEQSKKISMENAVKINNLFTETQKELEKEEKEHKANAQSAAEQLIKLKNSQSKNLTTKGNPKENEKVFDINDWEVDYDE